MRKVYIYDDEISEVLYNWAVDNYCVQDAFDVDMSLLEFVYWYRFPEFRQFMKDRYNIDVVK